MTLFQDLPKSETKNPLSGMFWTTELPLIFTIITLAKLGNLEFIQEKDYCAVTINLENLNQLSDIALAQTVQCLAVILNYMEGTEFIFEFHCSAGFLESLEQLPVYYQDLAYVLNRNVTHVVGG